VIPINSSTYISTYYKGSTQQKKIKIIKELYRGEGLEHYKKRYIDDKVLVKNYVDYKKRYETSNYMNLMVDEFLEFIPLMSELEGISSVNDSVVDKKNTLFKKWLKKINWKNLSKSIGKYRKLGGDVYIHWWIEEDKTGFRYPQLKLLDAEFMEIKNDVNEEIEAYIWTKSIDWQERLTGDSANYLNKSKTVKFEFLRGSTNVYEDSIYQKTIDSDIEYIDEFQLIHLQYMKEEDSNYSIIPCESLVDGCIRLDKIETTISTTNLQSGSPQLVVQDGTLRANSGFGANGILYVDSLNERDAKWGQLEITNGLQSMMLEWENVLNTQYKRANLVQPKLLETLSTTDSSKVISSIRINTENEIEDLFLEIQDKTQLLIYILFKENRMYTKKDDLRFKIPDVLINLSAFDEYLLRTQQMAIGVKTVQDNLKDYGYTKPQADKRIKQINEEIVNGNNDISINKTSKNTVEVLENSPNLDNNFKNN